VYVDRLDASVVERPDDRHQAHSGTDRRDHPKRRRIGAGGVETLVDLFGGRRASRTELMRVRVVGSALLAAVSVALEAWQSDDGRSDLLALLDQATEALAASMSELGPGTRRRVARPRR
jgi:hypothetical protein